MSGIFLSYRRDDAAGYAGRVADDLKERFGDRLFMDIDTVEPGLDFVEEIERAVQSCVALVVVIGKQWLGSVDGAGRRRLEDPGDYVRLEVATALKRKIRVIPVLVQNTLMPLASELPPDLAPLTRRNAIDIADTRWKYDIDRLIHTLEKVLGTPPKVITPPPPEPSKRKGSFFQMSLLLVSLFLWLVAVGLAGSTPTDQKGAPYFFLAGVGTMVWWVRRRRRKT
jgi:hypothetical protein